MSSYLILHTFTAGSPPPVNLPINKLSYIFNLLLLCYHYKARIYLHLIMVLYYRINEQMNMNHQGFIHSL